MEVADVCKRRLELWERCGSFEQDQSSPWHFFLTSRYHCEGGGKTVGWPDIDWMHARGPQMIIWHILILHLYARWSFFLLYSIYVAYPRQRYHPAPAIPPLTLPSCPLPHPQLSPQATLFPFLFFFGTSLIVRPASTLPVSLMFSHELLFPAHVSFQNFRTRYSISAPHQFKDASSVKTYWEASSASTYPPYPNPSAPACTRTDDIGLWTWSAGICGCALCVQLRIRHISK